MTSKDPIVALRGNFEKPGGGSWWWYCTKCLCANRYAEYCSDRPIGPCEDAACSECKSMPNFVFDLRKLKEIDTEEIVSAFKFEDDVDLDIQCFVLTDQIQENKVESLLTKDDVPELATKPFLVCKWIYHEFKRESIEWCYWCYVCGSFEDFKDQIPVKCSSCGQKPPMTKVDFDKLIPIKNHDDLQDIVSGVSGRRMEHITLESFLVN